MALKIGTEDRKKVMLAGVLGAIVLVLLIRTFWSSPGDSSPAAAPAAMTAVPAAATATPATQERTAVRAGSSMANLDPTLHPELMAGAESLTYNGSGRNIFSMNSTPPPPIERVSAPVRPSQQSVPQGPPPPPPIDLKFFGFEAANGQRKVFLLHGEDVYIAAQGDVVDHRYKVLSIQPFSVIVQDLPYNNTQNLPLIQN